jgi:hypothetical protein
MNKSLALGLSALSLLVTGWSLLAQQTARPPMPVTQHINGKPVYDQNVTPVVESSLALMWETSDAIVDVQVASSEVKGIGDRQVYVRTAFISKVLRVYKGNIQKGASIVFTQAAGQLELPDKIIRVDGVEPLGVGERYVVFLRHHDTLGPWILVGERDGAFKVRNGSIQPQGFTHVAEEHRNLSELSFTDELERVGRHSAPRKQ